jgi:cytochrome c5
MMAAIGPTAAQEDTLRPPEAFDAIADEGERSAAMFEELGKAFLHQRCTNCHAAEDRPRQGDAERPHQPPVQRGADGFGVAGLRCIACHAATNFDAGETPGRHGWHMPPAEVGWGALTLPQICAQILDPERHGMLPKGLVVHLSKDPLVAWAWSPGRGREPAPGTHETFAALVKAWVETGAACPK